MPNPATSPSHRSEPATNARRGLIAVCTIALLAAAHTGATDATRTSDTTVRRTIMLGYSVDGRPITAIETGDPDTPHKTLIVGCIHGNECAGITIADRLAETAAPAEGDLWIVPNLNPDGANASTRGNARGVDLNRNFPWRWQRLSGTYYSGPRPLSEPETRIAYRLIRQVRPTLAIWFHQHLDLVDDSTGNRALEQRFAQAAGLRLAPLAPEPGSAVTWESHRFPRATAFVVELPAGALATGSVIRFASAVSTAVVFALSH